MEDHLARFVTLRPFTLVRDYLSRRARTPCTLVCGPYPKPGDCVSPKWSILRCQKIGLPSGADHLRARREPFRTIVTVPKLFLVRSYVSAAFHIVGVACSLRKARSLDTRARSGTIYYHLRYHLWVGVRRDSSGTNATVVK